MADFLIEKKIAGPYAATGGYSVGKPAVLGLIHDVWRIFAAKRAVYLELKDDDFRIHPVINPHLLVHCKLNSRVSCPGVYAAAIGNQVRFNVWDGSNAPTDLCKWT